MGHKAQDGNRTLSEEDQIKEFGLSYLDSSSPGGDSTEDIAEFIKDIPEFKKSLPFIDVPKVELAQC